MSKKSNLFTSVPQQRVQRSFFDLSHEVKMSGKFGLLYPVLLLDTLPGDQVSDQMTVFMRFAPMLAPIMHRIDVTTHFFFVPNRLLTDHWEEFVTGGQDGLSSVVLPYVSPDGIVPAGTSAVMKKSTLWDYFGLPVLEGADPVGFEGTQLSALPFRAYAKIWNDFYRDPNLDTELELDVELAGNVATETVAAGLFTLRNRMWEKDYFTSALPWAQRGAEVLMPLSGTGTVTYTAVGTVVNNAGVPISNTDEILGLSGTGSPAGQLYGKSEAFAELGERNIHNIDEVQITSSDVFINDFRRALAIQRWLENNARGGGRYIEQIESHFNTRVPDFRLQRAEYLGGGKQPVTISQVLSTTDTATVPVGDMAGHGVSVGKSNRFSYRCQEHGYIIGIMSVVPRTAYSQGIEKHWMKADKYDYAWPELAHLGEQEIISKEAFYSFDDADTVANNGVFGYIPRYAEYKFKNDRIAGDFRDNLAFWHLGRLFTARPSLTPTFTTMYEDAVGAEETYRRIFAVQDGTDYLWCQLFHKLHAKRPLPYFGVPQLMG